MGLSSSRSPPIRDTLSALLTHCETAATKLSTSVPALASLTAALMARNNESVQQALAQVASFRSALLARKTRVLGSAKRLSRKQCKMIVADFEAVDVSAEQLRVGAGTVAAYLDFDSFVPLPFLAWPPLARYAVIGTSLILRLSAGTELGCVVTGDGLRVVSASGPGLKWFDPHSRNEFSVVLAQADGSVPVWLTTGVVVADVVFPDGTPAAAGVGLTVRPEWVRQGIVRVVYGGLSEDAPEAVLQLSVCGAVAVGASGGDWGVRVRRRPFASHVCASVGTHVRTLTVVEGFTFGLAVSLDEKWLVVGNLGMNAMHKGKQDTKGKLSVYSLPGGKLVRAFGGTGDGSLQFNGLRRLCFAPNSNLIVVDGGNKRLQELTLGGVFVRFIGVGEFGGGEPFCVAVYDDAIAVGCELGTGTGHRVVIFDFGTAAVTSRFGEVGTDPVHLSETCTGIRFTPDGSHVMVAEADAKRVSLFTTAGVFVRCVGVGVLKGGVKDVLQAVTGEYVVADCDNHRVCVFSPDGSELVRSWGRHGTGDVNFLFPNALAAVGRHLYVLDYLDGRVQVFE